jgi:hypothetical protein
MWGNASTGPFLYHNQRGSSNYLFHILCTWIVVPLKSSKSLMASDGHGTFIVPLFSNFSGNEGMANRAAED